ncbi:hypothetical protein [Endozoicomonas sp. ONNA1]|uniref:hypothetical protein n=2 Tax=unclassified Endozoicomonas TaxID=2644528 RepID=UPI002149098B|nr:hypothetical protein [Endozoicomonas sp. ONNA1]
MGRSVLSGTATSSTHSSHSEGTRKCYWDDPTRCFSYISGDRFVTYGLTSSANIEFNQHNTANRVPIFFRDLLGNGQHNFQHRFHIRYTLRGKTKTTARNIIQMLSFFNTPFISTSSMFFQNLPKNEERVKTLEAATPESLPEHVSIVGRSVSRSYIAVTDNDQKLLSSNTKAIDHDTHIFDLFLNTPETRQWIIDQLLNSLTYRTFKLIIPELFNTARPANILVQQQSIEDDSVNLQPSHFLSLYFQKGTVVQYHLRKSPDNDIQVLAISVSSKFYTLTFTIDHYDASAKANQPPPHFAQFPGTGNCYCGGACNCATLRNNNTGATLAELEAACHWPEVENTLTMKDAREILRSMVSQYKDGDFNMELHRSSRLKREDKPTKKKIHVLLPDSRETEDEDGNFNMDAFRTTYTLFNEQEMPQEEEENEMHRYPECQDADDEFNVKQ